MVPTQSDITPPRAATFIRIVTNTDTNDSTFQLEGLKFGDGMISQGIGDLVGFDLCSSNESEAPSDVSTLSLCLSEDKPLYVVFSRGGDCPTLSQWVTGAEAPPR